MVDARGSGAPRWPHDGALHLEGVGPAIRFGVLGLPADLRQLESGALRVDLGVLGEDEARLGAYRGVGFRLATQMQ